MVGDSAGPLERAWLCNGFRVLEVPGLRLPVVMAPEDGEDPVLSVPLGWAAEPELREVAAGYAIGDLYLQKYGWLALVRGMRAWERIATDLQRAGDVAAD